MRSPAVGPSGANASATPPAGRPMRRAYLCSPDPGRRGLSPRRAAVAPYFGTLTCSRKSGAGRDSQLKITKPPHPERQRQRQKARARIVPPSGADQTDGAGQCRVSSAVPPAGVDPEQPFGKAASRSHKVALTPAHPSLRLALGVDTTAACARRGMANVSDAIDPLCQGERVSKASPDNPHSLMQRFVPCATTAMQRLWR